MNIVKPVFLSLLFSLVACGPAPDMPTYATNALEEISHLEVLNPQHEKVYYLLPQNGAITSQTLWSGNTWPLDQGSINLRWNTLFPVSSGYHSPNWVESMLMTDEQISELAPTEKLDLFLGRYDYPLVTEVANRSEGPDLKDGWAIASLYHKEPEPKTVRNPEGVQVLFGSADLKALLSYHYQYGEKIVTEELGKDTEINPGTFHVALTNKIGIKNESFLLQGHPVTRYAYRMEAELQPDSKAPRGTTRMMKIRTKIYLALPAPKPSWTPVLKTPEQVQAGKEYQYHLYLNYKNEILGGEWLTQERPGRIWTVKASPKFQGLLAGLELLLRHE